MKIWRAQVPMRAGSDGINRRCHRSCRRDTAHRIESLWPMLCLIVCMRVHRTVLACSCLLAGHHFGVSVVRPNV